MTQIPTEPYKGSSRSSLTRSLTESTRLTHLPAPSPNHSSPRTTSSSPSPICTLTTTIGSTRSRKAHVSHKISRRIAIFSSERNASCRCWLKAAREEFTFNTRERTLGLVSVVDASSQEPREDERDNGKRKASEARREELKSHTFFLKKITLIQLQFL